MARALWHAERGRAATTPNPVVGAVIVSDEGVVVGAGHHQVAGGPHAEVVALQAAGALAAGATLYCTLEPCSHTGRTGPCCVAVAEAGVRRVVVATGDPFPEVSGRGFAYLRERGIEVATGVGRRDARRQNAPFFRAVELGRPWVHLKVAMSLDGAVAARRGERTTISGPEAARWTQRVRGGVDAIAIGAATAHIDDPLLTARDVYRHRPLLRVVFDRQVSLSPSSRLVGSLDAGPVIVIADGLHARRRRGGRPARPRGRRAGDRWHHLRCAWGPGGAWCALPPHRGRADVAGRVLGGRRGRSCQRARGRLRVRARCRTLGRTGLAERVGPANGAARARYPHGSGCLRD